MCQDCYDIEDELEREVEKVFLISVEDLVNMKRKIKRQKKELKVVNKALLVKNARIEKLEAENKQLKQLTKAPF